MAQTVSEGILDGRRVVVKQPNPGNQDTQLEVNLFLSFFFKFLFIEFIISLLWFFSMFFVMCLFFILVHVCHPNRVRS